MRRRAVIPGRRTDIWEIRLNESNPIDHRTSSARECPQCAEAIEADARVCDACGLALAPPWPMSRLAMVACLVIGLVVSVSVCLGIQRLLGI
jgi:predicted nucleic acid-binding Zn ribbon protein